MHGFYPTVSRILLGLSILAATPAPALAAPSAEELLAGVQRWLDQTDQLEARFEQQLASGALGSGLAESGRLWIERPGRMRWDYSDPERKVAIIEGQNSRLYLEQDRQMWRGSLEGSESLLPALLAGEQPLAGLFEASLADDRPERDEGWLLRLVPRGADGSFEEVILTLGRKEHAIRAAEVLDSAGNRMIYRFSELRRNRGLPPGLFAFEPPPGTEILARP